MTLDQYIEDLKALRSKHGGEITVVLYDEDQGTWREVSDPVIVSNIPVAGTKPKLPIAVRID